MLFGSHGILLIGVKTYTHPIRSSANRGAYNCIRGIKSPFLQAKRCAKALEREFGGKVHVVIAVPSGASIDAVDPAMPVVRFRDLGKYVAGLEPTVVKFDEDRVRQLWAA